MASIPASHSAIVCFLIMFYIWHLDRQDEVLERTVLTDVFALATAAYVAPRNAILAVFVGVLYLRAVRVM